VSFITPVFPGDLRADLQALHDLSAYNGLPEFLSFDCPYTLDDFCRHISTSLDAYHHGKTLILDPTEDLPIGDIAVRELFDLCPKSPQQIRLSYYKVAAGSCFASDLIASPVQSLVIVNPEMIRSDDWRWVFMAVKRIGAERSSNAPSMIFISEKGPSSVLRGKLCSLRSEPECWKNPKATLRRREALDYCQKNLAQLGELPEGISIDAERLLRSVKKYPVNIGRLKVIMANKLVSLRELARRSESRQVVAS